MYTTVEIAAGDRMYPNYKLQNKVRGENDENYEQDFQTIKKYILQYLICGNKR
jgi:hypothetical protein